mmetsp:Transcript_32504/g.75542  ORF Transcript_32504/g.75542 Transcript_32504/m.75542 type:complete len:248 (+) Transcript_32504:340-1083(+)
MGMPLHESGQLLPQLARPEAIRAPTKQTEAEGVEKAAAIAGLRHGPAVLEEELAAAPAHLQRALAAVVHPSILVVVARLLEVRTSLGGMISITPVALLGGCRRAGPGTSAAGAALAARRLRRRCLPGAACLRGHGGRALDRTGLRGSICLVGPLQAPRELQRHLVMVRRLAQDQSGARVPWVGLVGLQPDAVHESPRTAAQVLDKAVPQLVTHHGGMPPRSWVLLRLAALEPVEGKSREVMLTRDCA